MIKTRRRYQFWGQQGSNCFRAAVLLLFCLIGIGSFAPWGQVLAADVEILTPKPGTTVFARNPETHLVLRQVGGKIIRVRVEQTGAILNSIVSMEGEEHTFLHFRLPLVSGKNKFTVLPSGPQLEFKYQRVQAELNLASLGKDAYFFHQDDKLPKSCQDCHDLKDAEVIAPAGLIKQISCVTCHPKVVNQGTWKHSTTLNQQCLSCHQQSVKPWRIGFPAVKIQEICFSCHTGARSWSARKIIHGPLILGGCTLCHNPHGEDHRYSLWAEGSLTLCLSCHSDKANLVNEKKEKRPAYVHGIIFGKGCVACHDPHASNENFMLKKPTNELCASCHPALQGVTRGHPVAGHPVAAPTEHRRPGRELTCVGCHEPHGASHQYLLIETKLGARLCRVCHKR
jgi:predicted CXXCH cytochrome family protein